MDEPVQQLLTQVERLEVTAGSVLVFKGELTVADWERFTDSLRERLTPLGLRNILILHLGLDVELEVLDEAYMAAHGWVRAPRPERRLVSIRHKVLLRARP